MGAVVRRDHSRHPHLLRLPQKELARAGLLELIRIAWQRQPVQLHHPLLRHLQPLPRGHEQRHARRLLHDRAEDRNSGLQIFPILHYQQQLLGAEPRQQLCGRVLGRAHLQPEHPAGRDREAASHRAGRIGAVAPTRSAWQTDLVDSIGKRMLVEQRWGADIVRCRLQRQARLAAAAHPQERDQPA